MNGPKPRHVKGRQGFADPSQPTGSPKNAKIHIQRAGSVFGCEEERCTYERKRKEQGHSSPKTDDQR
jgi:hypothetical protein